MTQTLAYTLDRLEVDSNLLRQIVQGDSSVIVTTEGGPVPSIARLLMESQQAETNAAASAADAAASAADAAASAIAANVETALIASSAGPGTARILADNLPSDVVRPVTRALSLAAARSALGPYDDITYRAEPGITYRTAQQHAGDFLNPKNFTAKGDAKIITGSIGAGSATLTASVALSSTDAGKVICIHGAGASGVDLITTISSASGTMVTLSSTASTSVTSAVVIYGTDDTAALQAVFDNVQSTGSSINLPGGCYLVPNGGLNIANGSCTLRGAGAGDTSGSWGTCIMSLSTTATLIEFTSGGCSIDGIYFDCRRNDVPTTSIGVYFYNGMGSHTTNCTIQNFATPIDYRTSNYATMIACRIHDAINYGIRLRNVTGTDYGDQRIIGCTFSGQRYARTATAAIRWESGGGLYVIGCKINGSQPVGNTAMWTHGVMAVRAADVYTQQIYVCACSIEGVLTHPVYITKASSGDAGVMWRLTITDNELYSENDGAIHINGLAIGQFQDALIQGNTIGGAYGIILRNINGVLVGPNIIRVSYAPVYIEGCTEYTVLPQRLAGSPAWLFSDITDESAYDQTRYRSGELTYTRSLPSIAAATPTDLWSVVAKNTYRCCVVDLEIQANVQGVGVAAYRRRFSIMSDESGGSTVTALGTAETAGATLTVAATATTVSGESRVRFSVSYASGTGIFGESTIRVSGPPKHIYEGTY